MPGRVVGGLEVQVVLAAAEELGGSHVHADDDLVRVAGFLDGRLEQLQSCRDTASTPSSPLVLVKTNTHQRSLTLVVFQDVGGKAALISHVGGILPVLGLDDVLQVVVDLNKHTGTSRSRILQTV